METRKDKDPLKPGIIDVTPAGNTDGKPDTKRADTTPRPVKSAAATGATPSQSASQESDTAPRRKNTAPVTPTGLWTGLAVSSIVGAGLGASLGAGMVLVMASSNMSPFEEAVSASRFSASFENIEKRLSDVEAQALVQTQISRPLSGLVSRVEQLEHQLDLKPDNNAYTELLADIRSEIDRLEARTSALATNNIARAGAPPNSGETPRETGLQPLKPSISDNSIERLAALEDALVETAIDITQLRAEIEQLASRTDAVSASLPFLLSAWERAQDNGEPFAAYLAAAKLHLPGLVVPVTLERAAERGIATAPALVARFGQLVPEFLGYNAGSDVDFSWYEQLFAQVKLAIGLRSLDQDANTPLAIVSRLETALANHDIDAAIAEYARLPDAMRARAGDFGENLALAYQARQTLAEARAIAVGRALLVKEDVQ